MAEYKIIIFQIMCLKQSNFILLANNIIGLGDFMCKCYFKPILTYYEQKKILNKIGKSVWKKIC